MVTPSCCNDIRSLAWQPLEAGQFEITNHTPVYQFDNDKSRYLAFELPRDNRGITVKVISPAAETVFAPSVALYDSQFNQTRVLGPEAVSYQAARFLDGDRLTVSLHIDHSQANHPGNEQYLVIYTSDAQRQGSTTLVHPAKAAAKGKGVTPPDVKDPVAQHAAEGVILLEVEQQGQQAAHTNSYQPEPAAATASTMLSESEALYNQRIRDAVAQGEIDKAMRLVEEAERAGSTSARQVFIDALKR